MDFTTQQLLLIRNALTFQMLRLDTIAEEKHDVETNAVILALGITRNQIIKELEKRDGR